MRIIHLDQMLESKGQASLSVQFTEQEREIVFFSQNGNVFIIRNYFKCPL